MNILRILVASLILSGFSFARAQAPDAAGSSSHAGGPARASHGRPTALIIAVLDTDHNGFLSAAEIAHAPTLLRALDVNDDGVLSSSELRRSASGRPGRSSRVSAGFNVAFTLDANRDGAIQTMEIANAVSSLKTLDANGDGELTPDELEPAVSAPQTVV